LNKEEHIKYWIDTAEKDREVIETLYGAKKYLYILFFSHLLLEKLAKALWIKNNEENFPPKIHNIILLLEQANVEISAEQKKTYVMMNDFQLEGRYPDYQRRIYEEVTEEVTDEILSKVNKEREWLLNKLL